MNESRFERMQNVSKPYSLQALREKLFRKPSWLSATPRPIDDDEENPPEACAVHGKPVALTREQAIKHHSAKISKLEEDLSQLKHALSLATAKFELLVELQAARANFWDTEKCRRIEAAVKELDARLQAVNANI